MDDETQLRWVMQNRSRSDRPRQAGTVIARMLKERWEADAERLAEVGANIDVLVDDEFRAHCRLAGLSRGVLTINVDDPAQVSEMRHRWLAPLRRAVSGRGKNVRVSTIVFALGAAGVTIRR